MGSHGRADQEAGNGSFQPYRDEPEESDDLLQPDAPIRSPQRPSLELGDHDYDNSTSRASWRGRLAARIPPRFKNAWEATVIWVQGPQPPRIYTITPIFPQIQHAPIRLLERYAPKRSQKIWLLLAVYASWLLAFSIVMWKSSISAEIPGYGAPIRLGCAARFWREGNSCGINGNACRPFANDTLAFRCPADCHKAEILNPHAVGDQEVVYKPLVVGGPTEHQTGFEEELVGNAIYRGDSFICTSAIHAGFFKRSEGGCGVLTLTGSQPSFTASNRNGIQSFAFNSHFPHSFAFLRGSRAECKDLRWPALVVTVFFTTLLSLFTTSPAVFFWSIFTALFFHVALASDPPSLTTYNGLISIAFGRLLPAAFCAWVTYKYTVLRTLTDLTAQIEKTILWLGPAWVGALNNYTFDKIPIQRLTPHDIAAQPGAIPALITVVLTIFLIALGQAWSFRIEGRMPRYLLLYSIFVLALLLMLALPGLNLRIHHYILALLLLPGTSFQNRPSLIYQGLLLGLFVNGIARWGFDSILQTPEELLQGAQKGTLLPAISVIAASVKNITFDLGPLPVWDAAAAVAFDGISVLVNDVERFRGYGDDREVWPGDGWLPGGNYTWTWKRHKFGWKDDEAALADGEDGVGTDAAAMPEYFRFGYMQGSGVGDFTKAGVWGVDGMWREMEEGPS